MSDRDDYRRKLQEQIDQYKFVENIHDLPPIFHYWSNRYLRPRMEDVLGASSALDIYTNHLLEAAGAGGGRPTFVSIGCGDCTIELEVARRLVGKGLADFTFECLDLSPHLLERGERAIREAGLQDRFELVASDILEWAPGRGYAGVMAHHALHHFVDLEVLFGKIRGALAPTGVFVTCDMIGRNGHMRWPEALGFVEAFWSIIPERYRFNHQFRQYHQQFLNWDCSAEGFEGIRAQDILPLLVREFSFHKFLAFGNLPDVFIDRGYGFNLDPKDPKDTGFIDAVEALNGHLIDLGFLKPTQMVAVMSAREAAQTRTYRHWTPSFCVRDPDRQDPALDAA